MKESGFCTNCEQEISTKGSTVIRNFGEWALIVTPDGRSHNLRFKKPPDEPIQGEQNER